MNVEDALTELDRLIADLELTPLIRRHAMLAASICHAALDRAAKAAELAAAGRRIPVRRADMRTHIRENMAAGQRPTSMLTQRHLDLIMILNTSTIIRPDAFGPTKVFFLGARFWPESRAKTLIIKGMNLWRTGHLDAAEDTLRQAAGLLKDSGQPTFAYLVLLQLGRAQYEPAPARAHRSLMEALDLQELLRDQVLDTRLRMTAGGSIEGLYAAIVRLLVENTPGKETDDWPPRRNATAFELVERSRSRTMLELLGQNLPPPTGPEHAGLIRAEKAARRRLVDYQAAIGLTTMREEMIIQLRAARAELRDVLERLAAIDERGAEYAQLRRGDPRSFDEIRCMLAPR